MKTKILFFFLALGLSLVLCPTVLATAENEVVTADTINNASVEQLTEAFNEAQAIAVDDLENFDGSNIKEPTKVPSSFGLWWQDIKENIKIAITMDPIKKAELQIGFAEQKVKLANFMIENSDDPAIQKKAQALIEKSNSLVDKIQAKSDQLTTNVDEQKQNLLENAAKHELNKEKVLNKIEDKTPVENLSKFQDLKIKLQERTQKFLNKISENANIPDSTKEKIIARKDAIAQRQQERIDLRNQMQDLLQRAINGDAQAKQDLQSQREQLKQKREEINQQFKQKTQEIINQIKNGPDNQGKILNQFNGIKNQIQTFTASSSIPTDVNKFQSQVKNRIINQAGQGSAPANSGANQIVPDKPLYMQTSPISPAN